MPEFILCTDFRVFLLVLQTSSATSEPHVPIVIKLIPFPSRSLPKPHVSVVIEAFADVSKGIVLVFLKDPTYILSGFNSVKSREAPWSRKDAGSCPEVRLESV